ncbi:MAG: ferrochelatase [Bacteroidota bacterium]
MAANGTDNHQTPRIGVVLMNLGGPTSESAVRPFLRNLFMDPDIIKLGGGTFQKGLAGFISKRRAPIVAKKYKEINACPSGCTGNAHCENRKSGHISACCSPINPLTERQREALESHLQQQHPETFIRVYTAMRYWLPFTSTTMDDLKRDGITHVVLLTLYPQFSWTTTGSSLREWNTLRTEDKTINWEEYPVKNYHLDERFIAAWNSRIDEALQRFAPEDRKKVHLVFSAHGTPLSEVRSGDPYTTEVKETMEAVMAARGHDQEYWLSFQSRVGPAKWTQPNTEKLVERMLNYGIKYLLMVPIAFVTDHIETQMELKIELMEEVAEDLGVKQLEVCTGLNDHPLFIETLAGQVEHKIAHLLPTRQPQTV